MKNEQLYKRLLLFSILLAVFIVALYQIFHLMHLDVRNPPPFKGSKTSTTPKSDWYNWMEPLAKNIGRKYGIPWQAILVQTALETGWGKSQLFWKYNNFGGVKYAGSGAPNKVNMSTGEVFDGKAVTIDAVFAAWPSIYEGLKGYAKFFHRNGRYSEALRYPHDPYRFIEEIKKAGYATSTNYVSILHGMLKNDLKVPRA